MKTEKPVSSESIGDLVVEVLDDLKAQSVLRLDVRHLTSMTDIMIISSGRSARHVRAVAQALLERCEAAGLKPIGVEGEDGGEWVLVDLGDVVAHIMIPSVREFYALEKLWDIAPRRETGDAG
ncbi:MAG: ribosome silencing factor [Gammaproteobacteria bacterium]|nr:ribosome silencing factor [Gammaproteobacteria bacterium]